MKRKQSKPNGFQRVLMVMQTGEMYTKEQLQDLLKDKKIHMYRLPNYMLDIKIFAKGIIKTFKNGRNVIAYQITNPETVNQYLCDKGLIQKRKSKKLTDISQPIETNIHTSESLTEKSIENEILEKTNV